MANSKSSRPFTSSANAFPSPNKRSTKWPQMSGPCSSRTAATRVESIRFVHSNVRLPKFHHSGSSASLQRYSAACVNGRKLWS